MTLTNTNFDTAHHAKAVAQAASLLDELKNLVRAEAKCEPTAQYFNNQYVDWTPTTNDERLHVPARLARLGSTICGLHELIVYSLKGSAAYGYHCLRQNKKPAALLHLLPRLLAFVASESTDVDAILSHVLLCGEANEDTIRTLNTANVADCGDPTPTPVKWGPQPGKAILVTGHDYAALNDLLAQIGDKPIRVYTHGEMLSAHAYPALAAFPALAGHFGTAWQNQRFEIPMFPGPVLFTTNCLIPPPDSYKHRVFAMGPVGCDGVKRIEGGMDGQPLDFTPIIQSALDLPAFDVGEWKVDETGEETAPPTDHSRCLTRRHVLTGFGENTLTALVPQIADAIRQRTLKHIFVVGGCDGFETSRHYFTDLVKATPKDTIVLTFACGRFRLNRLGLDTQEALPGIPRLIDVGQCNDTHTLLSVLSSLAAALHLPLTALPVSYCLSWFEQKAVADLLSLLHVGCKNIFLGPSLPLFFDHTIWSVLQDKFGLRTITNPDDDLKLMLSGQ
ncbi:putative Hydroxylamine reductase [Blattamonas nauphoetae]|nr:putative Hydroxylamine reductase [Blattamonas nauphoetae]KAK2953488.1 putative Hydroxylamine reductase [Blattamonas nauphoetae]